MKQIASICLLLIGSLIRLVFGATLALSQTAQDQIEGEEYDVSSVALQHFIAGNPHMIAVNAKTAADDRLQIAIDRIQQPEPQRRNAKDQTLTRQVDSVKREESRRLLADWAKRTLQNPKAFAAEISDQTTMDWTRRNYNSATLSNRFQVSMPVVILSEAGAAGPEKAEGHGTLCDFWLAFRKKYPEANSAIVTISRVGFNPERTQAIIEVGYATGPSSGEGYYVLLAKENGVWKIRYLLGAWIP